VIFLILTSLFSDSAFGADTRETIHQRILAGEQVSLNPTDSEDARTIDGKWIKEAALKHGQTDIHHAVIEGALDA
jgi:hypothetical protein